jgi:hypothetical protein
LGRASLLRSGKAAPAGRSSSEALDGPDPGAVVVLAQQQKEFRDMGPFSCASWRRARRPLPFLVAALAALFAVSAPAYAAASVCRTDPVVILTDGTSIDISASINTSLFNLQHVTYTVHAPAGSRLLAVVHTPNLPGTTESFQFYDDGPADQIQTDTIVTTSTSNVGVTATTIIGLRLRSVSGMANEHLVVQLPRR